MEVTLDVYSVKPFVKALLCLSRYGEELILHATEESLSLSSANSSKSAYCHFRYGRQYFSRYTTASPAPAQGWDHEEGPSSSVVAGQLPVKSLLSIFKHRTIEKSLERCEISIPEHTQSDDSGDGLESKLILRFHCKHGVIKTHKLRLMTLVADLAPGASRGINESCISIGPKALRDMIEHFVVAKGGKADPQLIWSFGDTEIGLKSLDSSLDGRGRAQLATELTLSCEEFDLYKVHAPVTIAFHLREFNATIAFAESMALPLEMKFTSPSAPLFIDMEGDSLSVLFIISTSPVQSAAVNVATSTLLGSNNRKRERNESVSSIRTKPSRMLEAHQPSEAMDVDGSNFATSADALLNVRGSPSVQVPQEESDQAVAPLEQLPEGVNSTPPSVKPDQEPLFWPSSSQLNEAGNNSADSFILYEEAELAPTQGSSISSNRSFQPLFED